MTSSGLKDSVTRSSDGKSAPRPAAIVPRHRQTDGQTDRYTYILLGVGPADKRSNKNGGRKKRRRKTELDTTIEKSELVFMYSTH